MAPRPLPPLLSLLLLLQHQTVPVCASDDAPDAGAAAAAAPPPVLGSDAAPLLRLTRDNFDATVTHHEAVLVEFTANWCSSCKVLGPEFARAAALARSLGVPAALASIDVGALAEWARDELRVERLPAFTLYRARGGETYEFPALTTGEAVVAGLARMLDHALQPELTPARVWEGAEATPLAIAEWLFWRGTSDGKLLTTLVYYEPPALAGEAAAAAAAAYAAFDGAARGLLQFSNLRFAVVRSPAALAEFELPTDAASLVLYTEHDEGRALHAGAPRSVDALRAWVLQRDTPLVTDVWHKTLQAMRRRVRTFALFFLEAEQFEHYPTLSRVKAGLRAAVGRLVDEGLVRRGEFTLAVTDGSKYKSWRGELGLPEGGALPAMGVEHVASGARMPLPDFAAAASEGLPEEPKLRRMYKRAGEAPPPPAAVAVGADGSTLVESTPAAVHDGRVVWVDVPVEAIVAGLRAYFDKHPDLLVDAPAAAAASAAE